MPLSSSCSAIGGFDGLYLTLSLPLFYNPSEVRSRSLTPSVPVSPGLQEDLLVVSLTEGSPLIAQ